MKKKELFEMINTLTQKLNKVQQDLDIMSDKYIKLITTHNEMWSNFREEKENKDKIIQNLTDQNFVDNPAYAAVALIPYRGKPTFVKDGKIIAEDSSEVTMTWDTYEHLVRFSTENN